MNLYEVKRYGNDKEGPNGADTNFVVRARSFSRAAKLADRYLKKLLPHKSIGSISNVVVELGKDASSNRKEKIVFGPFLTVGLSIGGAEYPTWLREIQWNNEWKKRENLYPKRKR